MRKRRHRGKKPDINEVAFRVVQDATAKSSPPEDEPEPSTKDPAAVARGRKGGEKGGQARANSLSAERRRDIARKAARSRWSKQ